LPVATAVVRSATPRTGPSAIELAKKGASR
jgi:hypothetical protein